MNIKRRKKAVTASTRRSAKRRTIKASKGIFASKKSELMELTGWSPDDIAEAFDQWVYDGGSKYDEDEQFDRFADAVAESVELGETEEYFGIPVKCSTCRPARRKVMAADSDYIKIGNRILPRNTAGMRDEASYAEVSREGKRRYDAEQEEKRLAAEKAAKIEKGKKLYDEFYSIYTNTEDADLNTRMEAMFDAFVPAEGAADSLPGELIRAIERLRYRAYNDGDRFNSGYGLETCAPSAAFIAENTDDRIRRIIEDIADHDASWPDEEYERALDHIADELLIYLAGHPEVFGDETEDSRDFNSDYIDEWTEMSHNLEFDVDVSGDYWDQLQEAGVLDWDAVYSLLEDLTRTYGGQVNQWARDAFTITDLDEAEYAEWEDMWEQEWASWLDSMMDEYADELEAAEDEYEENEEE